MAVVWRKVVGVLPKSRQVGPNLVSPSVPNLTVGLLTFASLHDEESPRGDVNVTAVSSRCSPAAKTDLTVATIRHSNGSGVSATLHADTGSRDNGDTIL